MFMLTQAKGLLLLVMVVAYTSGATATYNTYVSNGSSRAITATTSYNCCGTSGFVNRVIAAGTSQGDQYDDLVSSVHIEIWVEGAGTHNHVDVDSDRSIVGYDNADKSGVDIYMAKYGTLYTTEGGVLITIYLN